MLDPQRFTRGVKVLPGDLEPIMIRRLKSDLRKLGESFPERIIEPIIIDDLPADAPELVLSEKLAEYGELRQKRPIAITSWEDYICAFGTSWFATAITFFSKYILTFTRAT